MFDILKAEITSTEYFMYLAELISRMSNDTRKKVGAVLVSDLGVVISTGYNKQFDGADEQRKSDSMLHAEMNCIVSNVHGNAVVGGSLYCTHYPCNQCAAAIVQTGIKNVYTSEPPNEQKSKYTMSRYILESAQIGITILPPNSKPLEHIVTIRGTRSEDYFIAASKLTALRSKSPVKRRGAVLVMYNTIIGTGYDGLPRGVVNTAYKWNHGLANQLIIPAEMNCILNSLRVTSVAGSELYCSDKSCTKTTNALSHAGVAEIITVPEEN